MIWSDGLEIGLTAELGGSSYREESFGNSFDHPDQDATAMNHPDRHTEQDIAEAEAVIDTIHEALSRIARATPGFRERDAQKQMITEIGQTLLGLNSSRIIAVEGQTGTGKTLGYLLPGIPVAQAEEKSLVVATATTSLQSQLFDRELPNLSRHSGLKFNAVLAKGRSRYACPFRLANLLDSTSQNDMFGDDTSAPHFTHQPAPEDIDQLKELSRQLTDGEWSGCKDDLDEELDPRLWSSIASTPHSCTGVQQCHDEGYCPFHRARMAMRDADVIVANHDLVLSDLLMGGGKLLPKPKNTFYIFDEGHHLPEKAVEHGSARGGLSSLNDQLKRLPQLLQRLPAGLDHPDIREPVAEASAAIEVLRSALNTMKFEPIWNSDKTVYRAPNGQLPDAARQAAADCYTPLTLLWEVADDMTEDLDQIDDSSPTAYGMARALAPELGIMASRLEEYVKLFSLLSEAYDPNLPPTARWAEADDSELWLEAAPVSAAPLLKRALWCACAGAVITSATLTSLNRWSRFRAKAGLSGEDGTQYLRLISPFDYPNIAELHIPWMDSHGGQANEHTRELERLMPTLVTQCPNGTLCLFTSWRQLNAVYKALPKDLSRRVLCQGQVSRDAIVSRHRKAIEAGRPSVIFGLASMAEGIDLHGKACEHVIIAKLPFAPPTSPIEATRAEWLEAQGKNPFVTMAVPDASLKLIQSCGRLIRTETDHGRITLLDRRVVTKRYGRSLLDSLPPFKQVIERTKPASTTNNPGLFGNTPIAAHA